MVRMHRSRLMLVDLWAVSCLLGCHRLSYGPESLKIDRFRYRAGVALIGVGADTLRVAVVAINESGQQRELGRSVCAEPNAVAAEVRKGANVWDSEILERQNTPIYRDSSGKALPMVCPAALFVETFPPGAAKTYLLIVPVRAVLGDSLSAGRYRVTARVRINGEVVRDLDAGDVELRPPPI
jgi:hypothetical protein